MHIKDYQVPSHLFQKTELIFELHATSRVIVSSKIEVSANPQSTQPAHTLVLTGAPETVPEQSKAPTIKLLSIKINGKPHPNKHYARTGSELTLTNLPDTSFTLDIQTQINPESNRTLEGLYTSGGKFTTQCEAHGFRNITFYLDRPDVMSEFTTTIMAPKGQYQQLLSNGNPTERIDVQSTELKGNWEQMTWHDPFPKPCYLFAMVAGNLDMLEDTFTTCSGKKVSIHVYSDPGNKKQLHHAITSVKQSMTWDEETWGREYDLNLYQIVAVDDFNMGAMENKGLNIFNSAAVLADPKTASDNNYKNIQSIIGHEYFHNWSGNRVTLQKWFDLTLKEGLTVFRDQEFTADLNSRPVKRINSVLGIRNIQFPEDSSALAHPIRPQEVGSMDNFYTSTIYNKGAEVIRMIQTLIGEIAFRKGLDLYFDRHDGQAVTCEDFVQAMQDVTSVDLTQFKSTWYNQAGTPTLDVTDTYDAEKQEYRLTIKQSTPPTPGQLTKNPFHIPISIGLLNAAGDDMPLNIDSTQKNLLTNTNVLNLTETETTFVFYNLPEKPTPSLLRNWSAPVKLNDNYSRDQLTFLMANDNDGFNRWEAGQKLGVDVLQEMIKNRQTQQTQPTDERLITAFKAVLNNTNLDPALAAQLLLLPANAYLSELYPNGQVDVDAIYYSRQQVQQDISVALEPVLLNVYKTHQTATQGHEYQWNHKDAGHRALKNTALSYLIYGNPEKYLPFAIKQLDDDNNITDVEAALYMILNHGSSEQRQTALNTFYARNKDNKITLNKWFTAQALSDYPEVLSQIKSLLSHDRYDHENPNNIRSLIGAFTSNPIHFHNKDGSGYRFLADQIIKIDTFNRQAAASLAKRLSKPNRYDSARKALIIAELKRILEQATSDNVKEVACSSLSNTNSEMNEPQSEQVLSGRAF